jgi:hypothetical protein
MIQNSPTFQSEREAFQKPIKEKAQQSQMLMNLLTSAFSGGAKEDSLAKFAFGDPSQANAQGFRPTLDAMLRSRAALGNERLSAAGLQNTNYVNLLNNINQQYGQFAPTANAVQQTTSQYFPLLGYEPPRTNIWSSVLGLAMLAAAPFTGGVSLGPLGSLGGLLGFGGSALTGLPSTAGLGGGGSSSPSSSGGGFWPTRS